MKTFTILGASHYCSSFKPRTGDAEQSLEDFSRSRLNGSQSITRGYRISFEDYRACALREAERSLFLATSHYRRALDLMMPDAVHWAHVTLYYGSWFAAHGLLAMLGCSVSEQQSGSRQSDRLLGTKNYMYNRLEIAQVSIMSPKLDLT